MAELRISPDLALPLDVITQTTGIFARKGAGKTYTAKRIVEEVVKARLPVVVLDPLGAWWGLRSSADGQSPGLPVVILGGEHGDVPLEPTAGALIADVVIEHPSAYVLDLSDFGSDAEQDRFATAFMQRLYRGKARNRDPLLLVVDEADAFAPQQGMPGQQVMIGAAKTIARRARLRGLGSMWITQRPAILHADIRAMVELLILLQVTGSHDRIAIEGWLKGKASDEDRATVVASLAKLAIGEMWASSPAWLGLLVRTKASTTETFDSSKTPEVGEERVEPRAFAAVDLSALGEQIAATAERAKADDPKALRRRIAELEAAPRGTPAQPEVVVEERVVEIPVLNGQVEDLRELLLGLDRIAVSIEGAAGGIRESAASISAAIDRVADSATQRGRVVQEPRGVARPGRMARETGIGTAPSTAVAAPAPAAPRREPVPSTEIRLKAGARRMLVALAQVHPRILTRQQLSFLADVRVGGTFTDYLRSVVEAGYVTEDPATREIGLTAAGVEQVADHVGAGAPGRDELVALYSPRLKAGARRMLQVLLERHPDAVTRGELSEAADVTVGGTFSDYLRSLTANQLAVEFSGQVALSDILTGADR